MNSQNDRYGELIQDILYGAILQVTRDTHICKSHYRCVQLHYNSLSIVFCNLLSSCSGKTQINKHVEVAD